VSFVGPLCPRVKSYCEDSEEQKRVSSFLAGPDASQNYMFRLATSLLSTTVAASRLSLRDVRTPCLVCYRTILEQNAATMRARAEALGCSLRPHIKTVKTIEGAEIATAGTKRGLVCSTLAEVSFLAQHGFDDIIYAVPLTPDKLPQVQSLNAQLGSFHVMVDHHEHVSALVQPSQQLEQAPVSVYVMVDCGYHRDGVDPDDPKSIELVKELTASPNTRFAGLYTHGGHSYDTSGDLTALAAVAAAERDVTVRFAQALRDAGIGVPSVGVGSTPTCSRPPADGLEGVDEMHPGTLTRAREG
jgi:D-serine deaminase-like pyridoxal phosphate-dependent protein